MRHPRFTAFVCAYTVSERGEVTPPRILLVEDSVLLREGLVRLFDEAGYETVAALGDAERVVEVARDVRPDVAVLDVRLPPGFRDEGVRAAIALRAALPGIAILVLSQYVEGAYARDLLGGGEGGMGYLLKDRVASLDEFTDAIGRVRAGGTVLDPLVVRQLIAAHPVDALTRREREALELMAEGRTNAGIAAAMCVGVGAVEKHVSAIFAKLGLEDSGSDHRRVLAVLAFLQADRPVAHPA